MNITLSDLAVKHDYYCSPNNYFSNEVAIEYDSFAEFYEEFKDVDIDLNLIFRWDVSSLESDEYYLELFIMHQRKGIFRSITVKNLKEEDVPTLVGYLQKHLDKLKSIWKPLKF